MVYIYKGESNLIGLTLSERVNVSPVFFLFKFIKSGTGEENPTGILLKSTDISTHKERANIFQITEGESGDVELERGQYIYEVYATDTDESEPVGTPVEVGRMNVELRTDEDDRGQSTNERSIYD
tara:strand:- start:4081 stop:4455 length:375 start_codon:yes stop_codon:yes gene_type:complete